MSRCIAFVIEFLQKMGKNSSHQMIAPLIRLLAQDFPTCVQEELVRCPVGEGFPIPVAAGLAAFGTHNLGLIQTVPLVDFPQDVPSKPGALVEFSMGADGFVVGQVLEANDGQVKVDFNHTMIGKNLRFEVEGLAMIERRG